MRGYPQFSSWILIALAKICFFHIVVNRAKKKGVRKKKPEYLARTRDAHNECALTNSGTVLKVILTSESVDEILRCKHSNETFQQFFHSISYFAE